MIVVDDGGGMDPECMRQCMSLGYSTKKSNTTIGQCNFHGSFSLSLSPPLVSLNVLTQPKRWRQETAPQKEDEL